MAIIPDDKNWTWVIDRVCDECGYDSAAVDVLHMPALLRTHAALWPDALQRDGAASRPDDHTWSALEYGCHVRDVFALYDVRLGLMMEHDGPQYPNWDQDAAAITNDYGAQNPAVVAVQLVAAAEQLAARYDNVTANDMSRTGFRSDGAAFTIETFSKYLLHDPVHHLVDVANGYHQLAN